MLCPALGFRCTRHGQSACITRLSRTCSPSRQETLSNGAMSTRRRFHRRTATNGCVSSSEVHTAPAFACSMKSQLTLYTSTTVPTDATTRLALPTPSRIDHLSLEIKSVTVSVTSPNPPARAGMPPPPCQHLICASTELPRFKTGPCQHGGLACKHEYGVGRCRVCSVRVWSVEDALVLGF